MYGFEVTSKIYRAEQKMRKEKYAMPDFDRPT